VDTQRSILFAALEKVAGRESRRELLEGGLSHQVAARIAATVDGTPLEPIKLEANLSVADDQTRPTSVAAPADVLVAYFLGLLSKPKRAALLSELPEEFQRRGGKLPEIAAERMEEAKSLLERLRGRVEKTVRGAVICTYGIGGGISS
jgi:hypothetical protein